MIVYQCLHTYQPTALLPINNSNNNIMTVMITKPYPEIDEDDDKWTINKIAREATPHGWEDVFKASLKEIDNVSRFLKGQYYFPLKKDLFRAFYYTPLEEVKVILIGQDPYPQMDKTRQYPIAQGMAFSMPRNENVSKSMQNVYKELKREYGDDFTIPNHCDLTSWAQQGVLLLNASLTRDPKKSKDDKSQHFDSGLWNNVMKSIITKIKEHNKNVIFIVWGGKAKALLNLCGLDNVLSLECGHPSPMGRFARIPFEGNDHFIKCNAMLLEQDREPIDWQV